MRAQKAETRKDAQQPAKPSHEHDCRISLVPLHPGHVGVLDVDVDQGQVVLRVSRQGLEQVADGAVGHVKVGVEGPGGFVAEGRVEVDLDGDEVVAHGGVGGVQVGLLHGIGATETGVFGKVAQLRSGNFNHYKQEERDKSLFKTRSQYRKRHLKKCRK